MTIPNRPVAGEFYQRDRTLHPPALTPDYKTSVARAPRYALLSLQNSLSEITGPVTSLKVLSSATSGRDGARLTDVL